MLLGPDEALLTFKRELLLCQYQEIHAEMRREQRDYERGLREGRVSNFTKNPYRKEFGNTTVTPHDFYFIHQPLPCEPSHRLLISIHSATQVNCFAQGSAGKIVYAQLYMGGMYKGFAITIQELLATTLEVFSEFAILFFSYNHNEYTRGCQPKAQLYRKHKILGELCAVFMPFLTYSMDTD